MISLQIEQQDFKEIRKKGRRNRKKSELFKCKIFATILLQDKVRRHIPVVYTESCAW